MKQRLTMPGGLQLFFDDSGAARYSGNLEPAAVELTVRRWRDFVESWIELFETPRQPSPMEVDYMQAMDETARSFQRHGLPAETVSKVLRGLAVESATVWYGRIADERRMVLVEEVISTL